MRRLALLPALLLAGVCHAGLFTDDEAQAKIVDLQKQNVAMQDKLQGLDARVASQEQTQRSQGLDMLSQMEAREGRPGQAARPARRAGPRDRNHAEAPARSVCRPG